MMIKFLVLYARDIHRTASVYECLGLHFDEEQHGDGPIHLACEANGHVIEIYPGLDTSSRSALLGFEVSDLDDTKRNLEKAGVAIVRDIAVAGDQRRLIARDPDGREVFVQEVKDTQNRG